MEPKTHGAGTFEGEKLNKSPSIAITFHKMDKSEEGGPWAGIVNRQSPFCSFIAPFLGKMLVYP
jgi:hypothetical protein